MVSFDCCIPTERRRVTKSSGFAMRSIQLKVSALQESLAVRYEPRSWFGSRELVAIQTACHMQSQTFFSVATRDEALQTSYANSEESFPCTSSPEKVIIIIIARHKNTKTQNTKKCRDFSCCYFSPVI